MMFGLQPLLKMNTTDRALLNPDMKFFERGALRAPSQKIFILQISNAHYRPFATAPNDVHTEVQQVEHPSRVHPDIETDDIEAEAKRLENLGAKRLVIHALKRRLARLET